MTIKNTSSELVTNGDFTIPLYVDPRYNFKIDLEGNSYLFTIHWNVIAAAWYLDIEGISNTVEYRGIKLVTGVNLLKPYAIRELGALYMLDNDEEGLDPDYENIGSRYEMYYVPTTNPDNIV